jgi:hypothetical protein
MDAVASRHRIVAAVLLLSVALALPCFWHARLQAGDLASSVYNVWLADQVRAGALPGLSLVQPWTNFLFSDLLRGLIRLVGYGAGQKLAAAFVALVFFWGAFAFVAAAGGRRPWHLAPLLAIFTYGWTFHAGFFNYLLATGLSLWALTLLQRPTKRRAAIAVALLLAALAAHALPVACAAALAGYLRLSRRAPRWLLLGGALAALIAARLLLSAAFPALWNPLQFLNMTGADQAWLFGSRYVVVFVLLIALLATAILRPGALDDRNLVDLCLLSAAAVLFLPMRILLPGYDHALVYIPDRLSLFTAVFVCALAAGAKPSLFQTAGGAALAAVFFSFLYADTAALNRIEARIDAAVAGLPAGSRVVLALDGARPATRLDPLAHMLDRSCIGRCFSYGNYEASTRQFRLRALRPNPFVASDYDTVSDLQRGVYKVAAGNLPLFAVYPCAAGACTRLLAPGETVSHAKLLY